MFISMTGSAVKKVSSKWGDFTFIINSFNHRFLEVSVNLPCEFRCWEVDIQRIIKSKVSRGQVYFHLEWDRGEETSPFQINIPLVEGYYNSLKKVKEKFGLSDEINLSLLMQLPDTFVYKKEFLSKNLWSFLSKNIKLTLKDLTDTRVKEGKELQEDISQRINAISKFAREIRSTLPKVTKEYRKKLEQKLFPNNNEGRDRIAQEVLFQAGKIDISEEMTRISAHLKMFASEIKKKRSLGKRMDFICQELLREVNTMGAKINSAPISVKIVDLKTELAKIREQLRNVE